MDQRRQVDKNASKAFSSFTKFTANEDDLRDIQRSVAPDLSLANLAIQFQELQDCDEIPKENPHTVLHSIVKGDQEQYYETVSVVLGRILACKPYSADCERVISLYNKVKSTCRSSLKCQTMSDYLYIHMNMPPLSAFDPRPATLKWMNEKEHRTRNTPIAAEQQWFSKVFQHDNSYDNKEAEGKAKEKPIKRTF
jgi:hypothetical protein